MSHENDYILVLFAQADDINHLISAYADELAGKDVVELGRT
jgi:hypothetical protein